MRPARPSDRPSNASLSPGRGNGWLEAWPKAAGRRLRVTERPRPETHTSPGVAPKPLLQITSLL